MLFYGAAPACLWCALWCVAFNIAAPLTSAIRRGFHYGANWPDTAGSVPILDRRIGCFTVEAQGSGGPAGTLKLSQSRQTGERFERTELVHRFRDECCTSRAAQIEH